VVKWDVFETVNMFQTSVLVRILIPKLYFFGACLCAFITQIKAFLITYLLINNALTDIKLPDLQG